MDDQPPQVECIFCGAHLPPDQAAGFLKQIELSEDQDEAGPQPICTECQAGIDENDRERQVLAGPPPTGKTPYPLKLFFVIFCSALLIIIIETVVKRFLRNR
jgi:hypothetical protein